MIRYFESEEEKHLNDLLFYLRAHNQSFTGVKTKETNYVYVLENGVLLGGMLTVMSWDWVNLEKVFYNDKSVLNELIAKTCSLYRAKDVNLKFYTKDIKIHNDFLDMGFIDVGIQQMSPLRGITYCSDLYELDIQSDSFFHTISSKDIVNEYDIIMKEKHEEYKKKFQVQEIKENILYVAYEDDVFVGGIQLELYEDSLYIDLLSVNPKYKGKGIGTKLMKYAEKIAKDKGFISLDVGTAEFQAKPFYEKLGYKTVFTRKNYPKGFECYTLIKKLDK